MDFGFYYVPDVNRILFHYSVSQGIGPCCYDTVVSESRIADYIGIANGQLPRKEYYGRWRSFPDTPCDKYSFQETRPEGFTRTYDGVSVYDGSYPYNGTRLTPSSGGSMFEALMPSLFVPEETWAPGSWRQNHPLTVDAQIDHGMNVAGYGTWGFSPSNTPDSGYGAYGVDAIGMDPNGNPSNVDRTLVDRGSPGCPGRDPEPVVDLRVDGQRVVAAPGARAPPLLGDEQRRHEGLEHRTAPARRDPEGPARRVVPVAAVEHVDP